MPRRSNSFQKLMLLLNHCAAGPSVTVSESKEMVDKATDTLREVDIVLTSHVGAIPVVVSIEVTDSGRAADITWVEQQIQKHGSLDTNKLVLVSRSGFTRSAMAKAKSCNVDALTIDEAREVDWPQAIQLLGDGFFELVQFNFECLAVVGLEAVPRPIPLRTIVSLPYRDEPTDIGAMVRFFLEEPTIKKCLDEQLRNSDNREFTLHYTPQPGTSIKGQNGGAVRKLIVILKAELRKTPVTYSVGRLKGDEIVWGVAKPGSGNLLVAVRRTPDGRVEGRLFDGNSIKTLQIENTQASI